RHGLLGQALQAIQRPVLGILPDGTRPDEGAALDGETGPLCNLDDRSDIGRHGTSGTVGAYGQPRVDDLPRQPLDVLGDVRPGPRKSDIRGLDAEPANQVQNPDLL